jgi:uncharacterized protein YqjF (DUF2071 family)
MLAIEQTQPRRREHPSVVSRTAEQHISVPMLRASWDTLTFLHWPVAPKQIQGLLPAGLTVDVYAGSAGVTLAPFVMANLPPLGVPDLRGDLPIVPGWQRFPRLNDLSSSPETNLRTYVRGPDGRDGLWFLTLDIGSAALAAALRAAVGAPYHHARLTVEPTADTYTYAGSRVGGNESYRLEIHAGAPIVSSELQTWLTGRWRAYTAHLGRLLVTPVEHEPWALREGRVVAFEQNLTDSVGLRDLTEPSAVTFTEGVRKVRIGRPALVRT